jgi:hypothetical protein
VPLVPLVGALKERHKQLLGAVEELDDLARTSFHGLSSLGFGFYPEVVELWLTLCR